MLSLSKRPKCPNGTRRNKKTGECESNVGKRSHKSSESNVGKRSHKSSESNVGKRSHKSSESSSIKRSPKKPKSKITLLIVSHGRDTPYAILSDPTVRILSQAGKFGCFGFFDKIEMSQIKEWINRIKNVNLDTSTYSMLEKLKISFEKNYKLFFDLEKSYNEEDKITLKKKKKTLNVRQSRLTSKTINANEDWQIYTPTINHLYDFTDKKQQNQGIFIVDMQNRPKRCDFEVDDNLLEIMNDSLRDHSELALSHLIQFLHNEGFDIINIIDKSCRSYGGIMPKEAFAKINADEIEASKNIDKTLGGRKPRKL